MKALISKKLLKEFIDYLSLNYVVYGLEVADEEHKKIYVLYEDKEKWKN